MHHNMLIFLNLRNSRILEWCTISTFQIVFLTLNTTYFFNMNNWSPLYVNKLILYLSPFDFLDCEEYIPSTGIIQGRKYDKNISVSWPRTSLYCTAQEPRAASNSSALSDANAESTCQYSKQPQKTRNIKISNVKSI